MYFNKMLDFSYSEIMREKFFKIVLKKMLDQYVIYLFYLMNKP